MLGLTQVTYAIFAADVAFLIALVVFARETKKVKENEDCKELLKHENPISWLKASAKYAIFSILSSLAYLILTAEDIGLGQPIINFLLYFVIISFLFGLIFIARIIWFVVEPSSTANILAGKVLGKVAKYGSKFVSFSFIIILQSFNGLALYTILSNIIIFHQEVSLFAIVYLPTLVLSFIVMFPRVHDIIFRYQDEMRRRDWITFICFYSPWAVFEIFSILNPAGIIF